MRLIQAEPDPTTLIEVFKIFEDNEHRELTAKVEDFQLIIKQKEFEEFITQTIKKRIRLSMLNFEIEILRKLRNLK